MLNNVGILATHFAKLSKDGFYNAQRPGIAKALSQYCRHVVIYQVVEHHKQKTAATLPGHPNITFTTVPSLRIGNNGFFARQAMDTDLDALLCFGDTQYAVPGIYRWAQKNKILMIPYIGTLESHSTSRWKQAIINRLFERNLSVYRQCRCLAKTPAIANELRARGVRRVDVMPVGLDLDLIHQHYAATSISVLKAKHGYADSDHIILFIGRMTDEKQPLRMIDLLDDLHIRGERYHLLMIGTGELSNPVKDKVEALGLSTFVKRIDRIPNADIWELYRMADCFVNLNQQEIFGMAVLEAMYYGCKVVAWKAPGPSLIIEDGVSGFLVNTNEDAIERIINGVIDETAAHNRIIESFTWDKSVQVLLNAIGDK